MRVDCEAYPVTTGLHARAFRPFSFSYRETLLPFERDVIPLRHLYLELGTCFVEWLVVTRKKRAGHQRLKMSEEQRTSVRLVGIGDLEKARVWQSDQPLIVDGECEGLSLFDFARKFDIQSSGRGRKKLPG